MISSQSDLYSYNGGLPAPLTVLYLPNNDTYKGATRTNPAEFTTAELTACNYTGPYMQPAYDEEVEDVTWNNSTKKYTVSPKSADFFTALVKENRLNVLSATDYLVASDTTLNSTQLTAAKELRTAMRDLHQKIKDGTYSTPTNKTTFNKLFTDIISPKEAALPDSVNLPVYTLS